MGGALLVYAFRYTLAGAAGPYLRDAEPIPKGTVRGKPAAVHTEAHTKSLRTRSINFTFLTRMVSSC